MKIGCNVWISMTELIIKCATDCLKMNKTHRASVSSSHNIKAENEKPLKSAMHFQLRRQRLDIHSTFYLLLSNTRYSTRGFFHETFFLLPNRDLRDLTRRFLRVRPRLEWALCFSHFAERGDNDRDGLRSRTDRAGLRPRIDRAGLRSRADRAGLRSRTRFSSRCVVSIIYGHTLYS